MFKIFRTKVATIFSVILATFLLIASGFFFGFDVGKKYPQNLIVQGAVNINDPNVKADFGTFWQAWQVINDRYLRNNELDANDKLYGSISGLISSLNDPYSEFFPPEDNKKFREDIQGNFGGIGAEIGIRDKQVVVIAPLDGTPASRADLRPNDKILKIDDRGTIGIGIEEAVTLIRGVIGTDVVLKIYRDGWEEPRDIKIRRDNIVIPTVDYEMKAGNIAHIKLKSFNANANLLFYNAMLKALTAGAQGLILDLRGDPGGYLEVAVDMAGWFLPRGTLVVSEVSRIAPQHDYRASGNEALVDFPLVVLINGGSASASEILAGTLRDNRGVKLIGEQSFGKGTVQQLEELRDGSSLKVTIAHWVMPKGLVLEGEGLKPDYEVKISDEDREKNRDPQLTKAMEVLKSEISK
jgi:carboxyl-terminal processing protease